MNFEIIDSHIHIGKDYFAEKNSLTNCRGNQSILTTTQILKVMDNNGIRGLVMAFPAQKKFILEVFGILVRTIKK